MAAGVADFVLAPADIAKRLVHLARHPYVVGKSEQQHLEEGDVAQDAEFDLNKTFHLLRTVTGNDFTYYKPSTIRRRIHRRMVLHAFEKLGNYVTCLRENPAEVRALAEDLLICVTSFFREPAAFEVLARKVFPAILKNRSPEDPVRIWVPGCATGEEAYSIAICLTEVLECVRSQCPDSDLRHGCQRDSAGEGACGKVWTSVDGGYLVRKVKALLCENEWRLPDPQINWVWLF